MDKWSTGAEEVVIMVVTTCHTPERGSTMSKKREKPAVIVIQAFGGIHATARALAKETGEDIHFTTVSKWLHRGGNVPQKWHRPAINAAKKEGVEITLEQLEYWEG